MAYTINERALARWAKESLAVLAQEGSRTSFRFRYTGSTCLNGGAEFPAHLDLTLEHEGGRYHVAEAVVALDPEDTGALTSCRYDPAQRRAIVARNVAHSGVLGADLEEFLRADRPVNPGGCFCSVEHVNHKLLMALQTVRYYLEASGQRSVISDQHLEPDC
jgi:hypothetical protein